MKARIVGIGANVFDTLVTVPRYPAEDTKLRASSVKECGGGPCATGLVAAAKLGVTSAYIGALAEDGGGAFLMSDMKRFGMPVDCVKTVAGSTSFCSYVWLSEESTSRTCVFCKENLPAYTLDEAQKEAIREADVLMVDGNDLKNAIEGAKVAKAAGTKVLYDAGGLYEGIDELLPLADILIPSEEFSLAKTGAETAEDAARILFDTYHPELVVITRGVRGGVLYDGKELRTYDAFRVNAVDSNGAGDVFHGAFAVATVKGLKPYEACIFSGAVSALKCTKVGARDGVPTLSQTIEFLKEHGYELQEIME